VLVLLRGQPGPIKTDLCLNRFSKLKSIDIDRMLMTPYGYIRDTSKLYAVRQECFNLVRSLLESRTECVVSDTFLKLSDIRPYIDLGISLGVVVKVYHVLYTEGSVANPNYNESEYEVYRGEETE